MTDSPKMTFTVSAQRVDAQIMLDNNRSGEMRRKPAHDEGQAS